MIDSLRLSVGWWIQLFIPFYLGGIRVTTARLYTAWPKPDNFVSTVLAHLKRLQRPNFQKIRQTGWLLPRPSTPRWAQEGPVIRAATQARPSLLWRPTRQWPRRPRLITVRAAAVTTRSRRLNRISICHRSSIRSVFWPASRKSKNPPGTNTAKLFLS